MRIIVKHVAGLSYVGEYEYNSPLTQFLKDSICIHLQSNVNFKLLIPLNEICEIYVDNVKYCNNEVNRFLDLQCEVEINKNKELNL